MSEALPQYDDAVEQQVEKLASVLDSHKLTHLEYKDETTHIVLKKEQASLPGAAFAAIGAHEALGLPLLQNAKGELDAAAQNAATNETLPSGYSSAGKGAAGAQDAFVSKPASPAVKVTAPLVGLAYKAKEPGAEPFVKPGDKVAEGTVLCLIEAMKMFNEVKAPEAGTISKVHFNDGELVEFGAPLFSLDV